MCDKNLCIWAYEEDGVGVDFNQYVIRDKEVIDLLISLLYAAALNGRIECHFPSTVDIKIGETTYNFLNDDGGDNLEQLKRVLELIPAVNDMVEMAKCGSLQAQLVSLHPLIYPLLKWIVATNRSHLRLMVMFLWSFVFF